MEQIIEYIYSLFIGNGLVIAVGAFVIGQIIKQIDLLDNKYIPLICGVLGAAAGGLLLADKGIVIAIIQGLALGWAATGGFETIKNLTAKQ